MPDLSCVASEHPNTNRAAGSARVTAAALALVFVLLLLGVAVLSISGKTTALAGAERLDAASKQSNVPAEGMDPTHAAINEVLGLLASEIVALEVPSDLGVAFEVEAVIETINPDSPITLELWPHSVRAPSFRVRAQIEDGSLVDVDPGPERTLRGRVIEVPGAQLAGSLLETGLHAMILTPEGGEVWMEPLAAHLPPGTFEPGLYVVYERANAVRSPGVCGVTNHLFEPGEGDDEGDGGSGDGGVASGLSCVNIAIDADFHYYVAFGSSVNNVTSNVSNIVNTANNQYENEVGIRHVITQIVVRTSSAQNPYTTNNASDLLNEFRSTWNSQPEWSIDRNVAHLFTGRNLSGSTIGIAWLNSMCNKPWAYGLSQNIGGPFVNKTDLFAHEVGHKWNATHCTCNTTTMNPSLTGANTFIGPGSNSVNQIVAKRNSVTCPTNCPADTPSNNTCAISLMAPEGNTQFSTVGATTTGPLESLCGDGSANAAITNDIWYRHTAQCTGTLHVRLCNSSPGYDSKLAVYTIACPAENNTALACNRNHCGQLSAVSIQVEQGQTYRIRIGGHNGATGQGTLTIACIADPDPDPCPADLSGNGSVGVPDLLELLSQWGPCNDCDADLTASGSVGVPDLLELLSQWGPCP